MVLFVPSNPAVNPNSAQFVDSGLKKEVRKVEASRTPPNISTTTIVLEEGGMRRESNRKGAPNSGHFFAANPMSFNGAGQDADQPSPDLIPDN